MSKWVQEELAGVQLGDARRAVRVRWIVEHLSTHPGEHFAQAAGTKAGAKAMYRFFEGVRAVGHGKGARRAVPNPAHRPVSAPIGGWAWAASHHS